MINAIPTFDLIFLTNFIVKESRSSKKLVHLFKLKYAKDTSGAGYGVAFRPVLSDLPFFLLN